MMFDNWKVHLRRNAAFYNRMEVFFWKREGDKVSTIQMIDGETKRLTVDAGAEMKPAFWLETSEAQGLLDALWEDGFRPKDRRYENEMSLVNRHLEDMRKLVFKDYA